MSVITNQHFLFVCTTISDGNMSLLRGNKIEARQNKTRFLKDYTISQKTTVEMRLPHKNTAKVVLEKDVKKSNAHFDVDALITNSKKISLFMVIGDCLPIALFDAKKNIIALIHASWKSLNLGIIEKTITKMTVFFHTNPLDLYVEFGPSIGPCCYQHKNKPQQTNSPQWKNFITQNKNFTYTVDLWGFATSCLQNSGIQTHRIHNPHICTYHSGNYFSHRKYINENLPNDYRFAALLKMK